MNNHRCISQKSLITVRRWLLEAGDGLSTSICSPSSRSDYNVKQKPRLNKIIKRKRFNSQKYYSKTTSIIDWFYEFIKKMFTVYDESSSKCNQQMHHHRIDDTAISIMTCSTCQFEHVDRHINTNQSTLKSNITNLASQSIIKPKVMVTTATSSSNLNISQSTIPQSSKSTQTQLNHNKQQSTIYPLYYFSVKDGQVVPLKFSSSLSSTVVPIVKEVTSSSSPLCINNEKSKYYEPPIDSPIPLLTTDIYSYSSYQPTIASIPSSHSNTISLQTTQNFTNDDIISKIHRPSSSLHDTRICHFDKRNSLIECYHPSNNEQKYSSNSHRSSSTNTNAPEIVFAESTCQLIKQAWLSSTPNQQ